MTASRTGTWGTGRPGLGDAIEGSVSLQRLAPLSSVSSWLQGSYRPPPPSSSQSRFGDHFHVVCLFFRNEDPFLRSPHPQPTSSHVSLNTCLCLATSGQGAADHHALWPSHGSLSGAGPTSPEAGGKRVSRRNPGSLGRGMRGVGSGLQGGPPKHTCSTTGQRVLETSGREARAEREIFTAGRGSKNSAPRILKESFFLGHLLDVPFGDTGISARVS